MADSKLVGQNYITLGPRGKGHRPGQIRRRLPRRRHAVRQAAAQPDAPRAASRASTRAPRWRCPASRRSSPPTSCPARRQHHRSRQAVEANPHGERALTNEPMYEGEPILAVAAVDELTAAEAIERIDIDMGAAAVRRRSAGEPAARRPERADSKAMSGCRPSRATPGGPFRRLPAIEELKWTDADFADYARGPAADGQGRRRMVVRRSRCRIQERRAGPRRNIRDAEHQPPDARAAHGDGLLAERQAVHALLDAEHGADGRRRCRAGWHRPEATSSSSANTPAAASAARRPATIIVDRFRRCCRRRPTRR